MARLPRIQFPGALYHVLNQGNYQQELFSTPTEASSFISCLTATCEKMGWIVHAYGLLRNHYHLAIETPHANLSEGMHWLQGTYANRLNRSRSQKGHLFQGRYKAILVEPGRTLTDLVNYIHLKPVTEKLIPIEQLPQFRWSSFRSFRSEDRPTFLNCSNWLKPLGLNEGPTDWKAYYEYLKSIASEINSRKKNGKESMTSGWVLGSTNFKKLMVKELKRLQITKNWNISDLHEASELSWSQFLEEGIRHLQKTTQTNLSDKKSALWKLMIATWMRQQTNVSNKWLAEHLQMGTPGTVSAYVGQFIRKKSAESDQFQKLSRKLNKLKVEP